MFKFALFAVSQLAIASALKCHEMTDCMSCAAKSSWVPGSHCRWCPQDGHCHAEMSYMNPCSKSQQVTDPSECANRPSPSPPVTLYKAGPKVVKVLTAVFNALKIHDVDVAQCANDAGNAGVYLKDFADDVTNMRVEAAAADLAASISALSSAVSGCNVPEVTGKLDALAAAIKWAHVSTSGIDRFTRIIVDASDLWQDIEALARAVSSGDSNSIGSGIGTLLSQWTSITGGCKPSNKACKFVDGLLRVMQVVATDFAPCERAVLPVYDTITKAMDSFKSGDYKNAVTELALALDDLANAVTGDSCGMTPLIAVLQKVAPKLAKAIVKISSSHGTQIMVDSMDVYDKLFKAVEDLEKGDVSGFGMQMGGLLQMLQASNCQTKVCTVLTGVLSSLRLEAQDFDACAGTLDEAWGDFELAIRSLERKDWATGIKSLGDSLGQISNAVSSCDIPQLGKILEDTASKLGAKGVAQDIGQVVSVLVEGSDITLGIQTSISDFQAKSWSTFGHDLGNLATDLTNTKCTAFVCKVVEGILNAAAIPFEHLQQCEATLKIAETKFIAGSNYFHDHNYETGLTYYASAMNEVSQAVSDCGLTQELNFMQQEANVLQLANTTLFGKIATVLVHGTDFYAELYDTLQAFETHDYRTAGAKVHKILDDLSQWTKGHACTSPACYVVLGVLQYFGDIQGSIQRCESDVKNAFHNFTAAIGEFDHRGRFSTDKHNIMNGLRDVGFGLRQLAAAVDDCDLEDLAKILSALAVKLGIAPEIQVVDDVIKIVIEGAEIERDVGDAFVDFSNKDWSGFGYDIIRLVKTLL